VKYTCQDTVLTKIKVPKCAEKYNGGDSTYEVLECIMSKLVEINEVARGNDGHERFWNVAYRN